MNILTVLLLLILTSDILLLLFLLTNVLNVSWFLFLQERETTIYLTVGTVRMFIELTYNEYMSEESFF